MGYCSPHFYSYVPDLRLDGGKIGLVRGNDHIAACSARERNWQKIVDVASFDVARHLLKVGVCAPCHQSAAQGPRERERT